MSDFAVSLGWLILALIGPAIFVAVFTGATLLFLTCLKCRGMKVPKLAWLASFLPLILLLSFAANSLASTMLWDNAYGISHIAGIDVFWLVFVPLAAVLIVFSNWIISKVIQNQSPIENS